MGFVPVRVPDHSPVGDGFPVEVGRLLFCTVATEGSVGYPHDGVAVHVEKRKQHGEASFGFSGEVARAGPRKTPRSLPGTRSGWPR